MRRTLYLEKLYGRLVKAGDCENRNSHVLVEDIDIIRGREEREKKAVSSNGMHQGYHGFTQLFSSMIPDPALLLVYSRVQRTNRSR